MFQTFPNQQWVFPRKVSFQRSLRHNCNLLPLHTAGDELFQAKVGWNPDLHQDGTLEQMQVGESCALNSIV
jgi:hypothetical protein